MSTTYIPDLGRVASDTRGGGTWWLAASRALDALMDRLRRDELVDDGPSGDFAEAVWAAPDLAPRADRLRRDRAELMDRARRLRQRLSSVAGDPGAVEELAGELSDLARDESRYRHRSIDLVWESVNRDIGGE
ncbi:MAG: hypothetical protein GC156_00125 [Actinomycetales bacterium]|nr:hypothetical protein [Actinomycetales bacterium]